MAPFVLLNRIERDDPQARQLRKVADHLLRYIVAKLFQAGVRTGTIERQDGDRFYRARKQVVPDADDCRYDYRNRDEHDLLVLPDSADDVFSAGGMFAHCDLFGCGSLFTGGGSHRAATTGD